MQKHTSQGKPKADAAMVRKLRYQDSQAIEIAQRFNIERQRLSRALEEPSVAMPIRAELRPLYPPHWQEAKQPRSLRLIGVEDGSFACLSRADPLGYGKNS